MGSGEQTLGGAVFLELPCLGGVLHESRAACVLSAHPVSTRPPVPAVCGTLLTVLKLVPLPTGRSDAADASQVWVPGGCAGLTLGCVCLPGRR